MSGTASSAGQGGSADGGADSADDGTAGAAASGGLGAHAIASTRGHTCALDDAGTIHCWGLEETPWQIPTGAFVSLHSSTDAFCAIRADHTVACFDPPGSTSGLLAYAPQGKLLDLVLSRGFFCGIDEDGAALCDWSASFASDLSVPPGETFTALSAGYHFACGIRAEDGSVQCWGDEGAEPCVLGPAAGQLAAPPGRFVAISSRSYSSCAVEENGAVQCWGAGEAGDDPAASCGDILHNYGQSVPPEGSFQTVSVASFHSCGVRTDGSLACWGAGTGDECPDVGVHCRQSQPPAGVFAQVSNGTFHSCAMTAERKVQCWGYDTDGDGRTMPPAVFQ